jgi:hypothetical protein
MLPPSQPARVRENDATIAPNNTEKSAVTKVSRPLSTINAGLKSPSSPSIDALGRVQGDAASKPTIPSTTPVQNPTRPATEIRLPRGWGGASSSSSMTDTGGGVRAGIGAALGAVGGAGSGDGAVSTSTSVVIEVDVGATAVTVTPPAHAANISSTETPLALARASADRFTIASGAPSAEAAAERVIGR